MAKKYNRIQKVVPYVRRNKHTGKKEAIRPHKRKTSYAVPTEQIRTRHANRKPLSKAKDNVIRANLISPHQWMGTPGSGDIEGVDRAPMFPLRDFRVSTQLKHLFLKILMFNEKLPKTIKVKKTPSEMVKYFNNKLNKPKKEGGFGRDEKFMKRFMDRYLLELYKSKKPKLDALRKK